MFLKAISESSERDFTWKLTSMNFEPNLSNHYKIKPAQTDLKFISKVSRTILSVRPLINFY